MKNATMRVIETIENDVGVTDGEVVDAVQVYSKERRSFRYLEQKLGKLQREPGGGTCYLFPTNFPFLPHPTIPWYSSHLSPYSIIAT